MICIQYSHAAIRIVAGLLDFNDYCYVQVLSLNQAILDGKFFFLMKTALLTESLVYFPPDWPQAVNIMSFSHCSNKRTIFHLILFLSPSNTESLQCQKQEIR